MTTTPALVALQAELESLRASVASLESQLLDARHSIDLSMRNQMRCRACRCRRIAHAFHVLDHGDNDARKKLALYRPSWWSARRPTFQ